MPDSDSREPSPARYRVCCRAGIPGKRLRDGVERQIEEKTGFQQQFGVGNVEVEALFTPL
jgi:hypothetical protein